jgi:hypothetical protein
VVHLKSMLVERYTSEALEFIMASIILSDDVENAGSKALFNEAFAGAFSVNTSPQKVFYKQSKSNIV